ncbi:MAG TPA: hypothetical protein PLQ57_05410 [Saprospiraceae bacterium]|nr:hypothetical protein [Saprospiraceae bacterium]HRG20443.1 hypothetical protein [Saprospiraceae bacterium]HRG65245.1 hypothetical protein [Saprospiraceae bacterium]
MSKAESFIILKEDLQRYARVLGEAADVIRDQDVSKYPVFVAHQQEVSIGLPIIEKEKNGGNWNIHASTLEEFAAKNLIFDEKIDDFIKTYKDPDAFVCVFVLSELGANFVFLPRNPES